MLHCYSVFSIYTIREHVLDFLGIRIPPLPGFEPAIRIPPLPGFEPANFDVEGRLKQIESFVPPLCPSSHVEAQSADVSVIHLPNGDARPGNLKPSHVLAS